MPEHRPPMVSVVLANYNGASFLSKTVESVLEQTFKDYEFIIVDDGSTDESIQIIKSFEDPRIKFFQNEKNYHVSYTHNIANRHVQGKYIACIDSDDIWKPEKLAKQVSYMEAHPDVGACFTQVEFIDEYGCMFQDERLLKIFDTTNKSREEWLHELLTTGNHLANDSSIIRTEVMQEIGENNLCLIQLHDYDMWIKIALNHELYLFEEPMLFYRKFKGSGSISDLTWKTYIRSDFEFSWIIGNTVLKMSPALFRKVFHNEMKDPETSDESEILCEKALILSSDLLHKNCKMFAFYLFDQIMQDTALQSILTNKYGVNQHDIYRMTGSPIFYTSHIHDKWSEMEQKIQQLDTFLNDQKIKIKQLETSNARLSSDIEQIKQSSSWKLTSPLRALGQLKQFIVQK